MDYASVTEVKAYAPNITGTNLDALIASLIVTESNLVDTYLEHPLDSASYSETYDGEDNTLLALQHWPITAVSSVVVDGLAWIAAVNASDIGYRKSKRFLVAKGQRFPRGFGNVAVSYTAGGDAAELQDAKQAVIELVTFRLGERNHLDQASKILAGETISYRNVAIPVTVVERLDQMKSYVMSPGV